MSSRDGSRTISRTFEESSRFVHEVPSQFMMYPKPRPIRLLVPEKFQIVDYKGDVRHSFFTLSQRTLRGQPIRRKRSLFFLKFGHAWVICPSSSVFTRISHFLKISGFLPAFLGCHKQLADCRIQALLAQLDLFPYRQARAGPSDDLESPLSTQPGRNHDLRDHAQHG